MISGTLLKMAPLLNIIFYSLALDWVRKIHKRECRCAEEWRLDFIKAYFITAILWTALIIFMSFVKPSGIPVLFKYGGPLFSIWTVVYAGIALSYFVNLMKRKCECSAGGQRNFMYVMAIIQIISFGLGIAALAMLKARGYI
jgi:hypothetical protein